MNLITKIVTQEATFLQLQMGLKQTPREVNKKRERKQVYPGPRLRPRLLRQASFLTETVGHFSQRKENTF